MVYQDPTGCLMAFRFSPFEVRDDSNPSGDGLSHLSRAKSGGAATQVLHAKGPLLWTQKSLRKEKEAESL